ncbi:MAG: YggT family protein [bacterium]|nr:YggT family protein [bacterium]
MNLVPILIWVINLAYDIYVVILFARIILSWTNPNLWNPLIQWIYKLTDPFLQFIRRIVPLQIYMFDFSPVLAFLFLSIVRWVLVGILAALMV